MPQINFSFSGWISGANIGEAYDGENDIDVSSLTSEELLAKINSGELSISLIDALRDHDNSEVELIDYEVC